MMLVLSWEREKERIHIYDFSVCITPRRKRLGRNQSGRILPLGWVQQNKKQVLSLLSIPPGVEPDYKLHRTRNCIHFVHHYITSIQYITWASGGPQLMVVERMNKLRIEIQSQPINKRHRKSLLILLTLPHTPHGPLVSEKDRKASQILHLRVTDAENHPARPITFRLPVSASFMPQLMLS